MKTPDEIFELLKDFRVTLAAGQKCVLINTAVIQLIHPGHSRSSSSERYAAVYQQSLRPDQLVNTQRFLEGLARTCAPQHVRYFTMPTFVSLGAANRSIGKVFYRSLLCNKK